MAKGMGAMETGENCECLFSLSYFSEFYSIMDLSVHNNILAQIMPPHSLAQWLAAFKWLVMIC